MFTLQFTRFSIVFKHVFIYQQSFFFQLNFINRCWNTGVVLLYQNFQLIWHHFNINCSERITLCPEQTCSRKLHFNFCWSIQPCCNFCTKAVRLIIPSLKHHHCLLSGIYLYIALTELRQSGINEIALVFQCSTTKLPFTMPRKCVYLLVLPCMVLHGSVQFSVTI